MNTDHHPHEWTPAGTHYTCTDCTETTPACNTCTQPVGTSLPICDRCLTRAANTIRDIREAANTPYAYTLGIKAVRYDRDTISGTRSGDDPLGSTPAPDQDPPGLAELAAQRGINLLAILRDPPNVLEPVIGWAENWADHLNENCPRNILDYLTSRHMWAASNPDTSGWHDYLTETRTIRNRLYQLVGLGPKTEPVPCVHCGGTIIQRNSTLGLEDNRYCTGCGTTWDSREQLNWVNLTYYRAIPDTHPDTLVTTEDARRIIPDLKRNTLNQWLVRGVITPAADDVGAPRKNARGALLYRIGDIHNRHQKDPNGERHPHTRQALAHEDPRTAGRLDQP